MICNFGYMKVENVGWSSEHRPLVIVKLRLPSYKPKPIIWIDAGMHAREWIAPATAMFMIKKILEEKNKDGNIKKLLEKFEVWIIPMFNPDGYEFSMTENRMWRKTRTRISGSKCVGIDPNRNFKREWGGIGSSGDACSDVYRGQCPEEAPCVRAFAQQLRCNQKRLHAYFSLHSFFQLLLTPNSYTPLPPKDNAEIVKFAFTFQAGVRKRFGTPYNIGPASFISIPHSGNGPDYVHDDLHITNSYIIELRNRNTKIGFLLPPENIEPSALETLDGIIDGVFGITQVRND
ncbi:carboxypeptidase A2-like [Clytia hemisphaerica]